MGYEDFNVVTSPWVPVVYAHGYRSVLSVLDLIDEAHLVRDLDVSAPEKRFSIFRFVQSLIYWSAGCAPPEGEQASWNYEEPIDRSWCAKVRANIKLFDLFGDGDRFCQVPKSQAGDFSASPAKLLLRLPQASAISFNTHVQDATCGICPSCLAMGLIQVPTFSIPGGPGYVKGICGNVPVFFVRVGRNFASTIRLNLPSSSRKIGVPSWVEMQPVPPSGELTILQSMTHFPRKCRLGPLEHEQSCSSCGEIRPLVRKIYFANDGSSKNKPESKPKSKSKDQEEEQPRLAFEPNAVLDEDGKRYIAMPDTFGTSSGKFPNGTMDWASYLAAACDLAKAANGSACTSIWILGTSNSQASMTEFYDETYPVGSLGSGESVRRIASSVKKACERVAKIKNPCSAVLFIASKVRALDESMRSQRDAFCAGNVGAIVAEYERWLADILPGIDLGEDDRRRISRSTSLIGRPSENRLPKAHRPTGIYLEHLRSMTEEELATIRLSRGAVDVYPAVHRIFARAYREAKEEKKKGKKKGLYRDAAWTVMYLYACNPGSREDGELIFPDALSRCRPVGQAREAFDANVDFILGSAYPHQHRHRLDLAIKLMEQKGLRFSWEALVEDLSNWNVAVAENWMTYLRK